MITLERLYQLARPCDGIQVYAVVHNFEHNRWHVEEGDAEDCQAIHFVCNAGDTPLYPVLVYQINQGWSSTLPYMFEDYEEAEKLADRLNNKTRIKEQE